MPRLRPPYPGRKRPLGKADADQQRRNFRAGIPWIMNNGGKDFAKIGTKTSTGTKVFALAGKVRKGGLIEVPMGVTIRQIVEEIGGGVDAGPTVQGGADRWAVRRLRARCRSPTHRSITNLSPDVGAIMGSGGLVVLDDADCIVDIARYFLRFTQDQRGGCDSGVRARGRPPRDLWLRRRAGNRPPHGSIP